MTPPARNRCDKSFELHDDVTVLEFMQMSQVENEQELRQVSGHPRVLCLFLSVASSL